MGIRVEYVKEDGATAGVSSESPISHNVKMSVLDNGRVHYLSGTVLASSRPGKRYRAVVLLDEPAPQRVIDKYRTEDAIEVAEATEYGATILTNRVLETGKEISMKIPGMEEHEPRTARLWVTREIESTNPRYRYSFVLDYRDFLE